MIPTNALEYSLHNSQLHQESGKSPSSLLLLRLLISLIITNITIDCSRLCFLPCFGEYRIFFSFIRILQQCFARVLVPHRTKRDILSDVLFIGLRLGKWSLERQVRSAWVPWSTGRCETDGWVSSGPGRRAVVRNTVGPDNDIVARYTLG